MIGIFYLADIYRMILFDATLNPHSQYLHHRDRSMLNAHFPDFSNDWIGKSHVFTVCGMALGSQSQKERKTKYKILSSGQ